MFGDHLLKWWSNRSSDINCWANWLTLNWTEFCSHRKAILEIVQKLFGLNKLKCEIFQNIATFQFTFFDGVWASGQQTCGERNFGRSDQPSVLQILAWLCSWANTSNGHSDENGIHRFVDSIKLIQNICLGCPWMSLSNNLIPYSTLITIFYKWYSRGRLIWSQFMLSVFKISAQA